MYLEYYYDSDTRSGIFLRQGKEPPIYIGIECSQNFKEFLKFWIRFGRNIIIILVRWRIY